MRIANIHHCQTSNLGDLVSTPMRYFFRGAEVTTHHVRGLSAQQVWASAPDLIVVGGGSVRNAVDVMGAAKPANTRTRIVAWGVGASRHGVAEPLPFRLSTRRAYDLIGSREFRQEGLGGGVRFVPCVSCMDQAFDVPIEVTREAVLYVNSDPNILNRYPTKVPKGSLPTLTNRTSMLEAIRFLGSAEVVVTNSFHGAYWGQLLGKRVVLVGAYSSKFHGFPHRPAFAPDGDWRAAAGRVEPYATALADARNQNKAFFADVRRLVEGK